MGEIISGEKENEIIEKIKSRQMQINFIPQRFMTEKVCDCLAANDASALKYIPKSKKTESIIRTAISKYPRALEFVDFEEQTEDIVYLALQNDCHAFQYVSKKLRAPELVEMAIKKDGLILKDIPKREQYFEICKLAVEQNGKALKHVAKALRTEEICEIAVNNYGLALEFVPGGFLTRDICLMAVENNGGALAFVPDCWKDEEMFITAAHNNKELLTCLPKAFHSKEVYLDLVSNDGLALEKMDERYLTEEICKIAVDQNSRAIEFVPLKYMTYEMCLVAVKDDTWLLGFVPEKYFDANLFEVALIKNSAALISVRKELRTEEICMKALEYDGANLEYLSNEQITLDICIQAIKNNNRAAEYVPEKFKRNEDILKLERELGLCKIEKKWYEKGYFWIEERLPHNWRWEEFFSGDINTVKFSNFDDFYQFLNGDLANADLRGYRFNNIDIKKYNLTGCLIDNQVLRKRGTYDDTFYNMYVESYKKMHELLPSNGAGSTEVVIRLDEFENIEVDDKPIYYITDIHLDHKILKKFPKFATYEEIKDYIKTLAFSLVQPIKKIDYDSNGKIILLIGGDVSYDFEICKIFYTELSELIPHSNIVAILGNHELWDGKTEDTFDVDLETVIAKYRKLFQDTGIIFLYNEMLLLRKSRFLDGTRETRVSDLYELEIISETDILKLSVSELSEKFCDVSFAILGGVGYSGYNPDFNAKQGIYRGAIRTLEEESVQSKRFEKVYNKLCDAAANRKVIIFTHMPKEDWAQNDYNSNWIYVNGHTHNNYFEMTAEKTIYADNQIGYNTQTVELKYFFVSELYDIFQEYEDGIYKISRKEYIDFNRGKNIRMQFSEKLGKIHMLKRRGLYCFIYKDEVGLYLLDGGRKRKLHYYDLDYYYENMVKYAECIDLLLGDYNRALKQISHAIKRIGGSGKIHGSIVDIDYFNHVFLNMRDGSTSAYFATSKVDKLLYPSLLDLLEARLPYLYSKALIDKERFEALLTINSNGIKTGFTYVTDTHMYSDSNIIKSLQYTAFYNVIRLWNEDLLHIDSRLKGND